MEIISEDYLSIFFYLSIKYLLSTYDVPGTSLGNVGIAVYQKNKILPCTQGIFNTEKLLWRI